MTSMSSIVEQTGEEKVLEILVDQVPVGVCIIQDGKFCYANYFFLNATGYTLDELMYKDSFEIVVPEDREIVRENAIRMLKSEALSPCQFRVICKDGSIIWVMATVKSIQYHGRQAVLGNYMEITGRKQIENALKDSEERYRELADSITDVFFAMDEDLGYTYWNKASELLTGIREEDAIGKSLMEIFPDSPGRRKAEKVYRAVLKTHKSRTFMNEFDIDDRHYIFEISAYPSRGGISVFVRDITKHKQADKARIEAEKEKSAFLEEAPVGIIHADLEGEITYVNKRFELESGYLREEIVGKNALQLGWFSADTTKHLAKRMAARLRGDPAEHWEAQFKCKDGHWIWIEMEGKILIRLGVPIGFQIIASNITERKQAEEALRQSEERYRTILEEMEDAYFEVGFGGHFTFVNNSGCRYLGYSREELMGMSYKKLTVEEDIEFVFQVFNEVYQSGVSNKGFPWRTIRKDGSHGFAETSVSILRNEKDEIIGFRGVGRDITERMRAEEALKLAAEEWRETFDSITDAISIHDKNHKILRANRACADIFHVKPSQLLGKHCYELHEEGKPFSNCPHKQTVATGKAAVAELYESNLGKYLLETTSPVFDETGEVISIVHITRDITEQKRQNERLLMTDRLASLGELASGAAHELNNPLTSIIGFSQLLMEREVPDEIREELTLINNEARRAVSVTNNFLSFARKHSSEKQPNQISSIIEDVLELRAYEHKANHIDVERHLDPNLPEIMVDYFQMQQVFMNVIINAEYFLVKTHNKGTLTITTEKENSTVRISFADDGPGIIAENLGRIFDPFFTTKEAGSGTGLGLSICHGIVNEHGGQIYATSQLGKGTTIVIELPIKKSARIRSLA